MKPFASLAIIVFSLVALLQLLRVVLGWEVTVNGVVANVDGERFVANHVPLQEGSNVITATGTIA